MYNIYDMLKKGADADSIAKAFTEEMNSAMARIAEEKKVNQKKEEFNAAIEPLKAWMKKYYGDCDDLSEVIWEAIEGVSEISKTLESWLSL